MGQLTQFKLDLIDRACGEARLLGAYLRGDRALEERIDVYCATVGIPATPLVKEHYSAVFISWCMRSAGASPAEFPAAAGHWQYAELSARNAENGTGLFWARQLQSYAPVLGDIIHFNRCGGTIDFNWIREGRGPYKGESGIVIELKERKVIVAIGNLEPAGNVAISSFALAETGHVLQRAIDPFVCVIEVGK